MPCRHASKPWHGDGSVTSTYSSSLYAHICAFSIYIYIYCFFIFANTYIFSWCCSLLLWVLLFSILLMFSNTTFCFGMQFDYKIKWKESQQRSHNMSYKVFFFIYMPLLLRFVTCFVRGSIAYFSLTHSLFLPSMHFTCVCVCAVRPLYTISLFC